VEPDAGVSSGSVDFNRCGKLTIIARFTHTQNVSQGNKEVHYHL
jgi:hypothetical protein